MSKRTFTLTLLPMAVLMLSACNTSIPAQSLPESPFLANVAADEPVAQLPHFERAMNQATVANKPTPAPTQNAPAQNPPELSFEQLQAIAIQPATMNPETGSRVVPEMLSLFREEEIRYTGGTKYKDKLLKFRLHVPENMEPGKTYPLILWLHGVGEAGTDNRDQLVHLHHIITYLTGPKKRDFFLLVPQTPSDHTGWDAYVSYRYETTSTRSLGATVGRLLGGTAPEPVTMKMIEEGEDFGDSPLGFSFAMLEQVREKYPVDPDRITVSGLSSGGDGTWRALERGPDIFAAAVPLVSWRALKAEKIEEFPQLKKIPIWAIYSSDDNGIDQARADFARVEAAGCNVKKSEFGLCGHNAWTPAMLQADIFSWLLSRAKKDGEYIAVADSSVDPDEMQGVIEVAERDERLPTLAPPKAAVDSGQLAVVSSAPSLVPAPPAGVLPVPASPDMGISVNPETTNKIARDPAVKPWFGAKPPTETTPVIVAHSTTPHAQVPVLQPHVVADDKVSEVRMMLVLKYYEAGSPEDAARIFKQLGREAKLLFVQNLLVSSPKKEQLKFIEECIDQIPGSMPATTLPTTVFHAQVATPPQGGYHTGSVQYVNPMTGGHIPDRIIVEHYEEYMNTAPPKTTEPVTVSPSVQKVVEECEKVWVMSSHTMYGLFAADWDKESSLVPDFVMKSTASELAQHILTAAQSDEAKFQKLCDSVLKLDNNPMSSPWFDTSGGRLQSDIKYSLSPRGKVLQAVFNQLINDKGIGKVQNADATMQKVLDKLEMIMD